MNLKAIRVWLPANSELVCLLSSTRYTPSNYSITVISLWQWVELFKPLKRFSVCFLMNVSAAVFSTSSLSQLHLYRDKIRIFALKRKFSVISFRDSAVSLGKGGSDDHDFLNIWPTSGCHGQKMLTMTMAKISKLPW